MDDQIRRIAYVKARARAQHSTLRLSKLASTFVQSPIRISVAHPFTLSFLPLWRPRACRLFLLFFGGDVAGEETRRYCDKTQAIQSGLCVAGLASAAALGWKQLPSLQFSGKREPSDSSVPSPSQPQPTVAF